jgi:hypothetical protein
VDVFGHDYVPGDEEAVPFARAFENFEEGVPGLWCAEKRVAVLTAEGNKMKTMGFLETLETPRHGFRVTRREVRCSDLRERI